jgi:hypothetical protein
MLEEFVEKWPEAKFRAIRLDVPWPVKPQKNTSKPSHISRQN